jgi:hypothetical protein
MCARYLVALSLLSSAPVPTSAPQDAPYRVRDKDWVVRLTPKAAMACEDPLEMHPRPENVGMTCRVNRAGTLEDCAVTGSRAGREWAACLSRSLRVKRGLAGKTVEMSFRKIIVDP